MMARDSSNRVSTLIDPESLKARPGLPNRQSSYGAQNPSGANLARHPSLTMKPLISFENEGDQPALAPPNANRLPTSRSVFGVDTLWEREMAKLKEMQAAEELQNKAIRQREEEEERRKEEKKHKKKKKGKGKTPEQDQDLFPEQLGYVDQPRVSAEPPILPTIHRASRRAPPKPSDSDVSSESDDENLAPGVGDTHQQNSVVWHSSEDEDEGPRRTTGVGPRYPNHNRKMSQPPDNDSEEDLPLVAAMQIARAKLSKQDQGSEDEDKPLSQVLLKKQSVNTRRPDNDDDDEPLALRASRLPNTHDGDEDDTPLAFHPEHQRRTQYQVFAQQQQQQMMMQAQMQSNMLMNASMMGSGFFGPPMMNPMMMQMGPPIQIPSPPPMHDEAKLSLVDRWRRDVVVDRENV